MAFKVYIDGQEGTTGLKINERLSGRSDVELLRISDDLRKDNNERKRLINASDFTFLCLPDDAAREAVSLVENPHTRILDASTAHRTNIKWAYGFPELSAHQRNMIQVGRKVAVPGCYATGFISMVYPIVKAGIMAPYHPVSAFAVSGYSGAGKKGIEQYEAEDRPEALSSPRLYALTQNHKHIREMQYVSGLSYTPMFNPFIDDYAQGMTVCLPLHTRALAKRTDAEQIWELLSEHYKGQEFVRVMPYNEAEGTPGGFLPANYLVGTNYLDLYVFGNKDHILVTAVLDNLGKGASGAAVQCMNIMMGIDERTGLV